MDMKFVEWLDRVYFSFYGHYYIEMFKKACLQCKEHFNSLILVSLLTEGVFCSLPTQTKKI
jgi:hypothetical protein